MNIKIVILTTKTPHHAFFVKKIKETYQNVSIYCENLAIDNPPTLAGNDFEQVRAQFEANIWFGGSMKCVDNLFLSAKFFSSLNSLEAIKALTDEDADVVIAFGVGLLNPQVISLFSDRIFNLHGGDIANYRGLDSHLWAIYHEDYLGLTTTLHRLEYQLDSGAILLQGNINIHKNMKLHELRAANTEICIKLALILIDAMRRFQTFPSKPQRVLGRYYSAMPLELLRLCITRFEKYTSKLN